MSAVTYPCPECKAALAIEPGTTELTSSCPQCSTLIETSFFPTFFRPADTGATPSALIDQSEASCFYHPQKQALHICDGCGRMICALCSVPLGSEQLCPNCISSGKKKGKLTTLEGRRMRYDSIALSLAVVSLLFYVMSFILAPAAIYVAIRHWNSPGSLLGVSKTRFVLAIIIAIGALLFWIALFTVVISPHHRK